MADLTVSTAVDTLLQSVNKQEIATNAVDGQAINPASIGATTPVSSVAAAGITADDISAQYSLNSGDRVQTNRIKQSAGILVLQNGGDNDFDRLQFGGTSSAFPSLKRSASGLKVRLADDSGDAPLSFRQSPRVNTYAYAATVTLATDSFDTVNVGALTGNLALAVSGTPADAQTLGIRFAQDATGGRTITYSSAFAFGTDLPANLDPATANAKWERVFKYNAADAKWRAVGFVSGF